MAHSYGKSVFSILKTKNKKFPESQSLLAFYQTYKSFHLVAFTFTDRRLGLMICSATEVHGEKKL